MSHTQKPILKRDFANTLARGLAILELFSSERVALSTTEVAEGVDVSRAAARRLLLTLQELGYVNSNGRVFWLTPKVLAIGRGLLAANSVWNMAAGEVVKLADENNEPCSISILDGLDIIFVCRDATRRIFTSRLVVGDRLPAHCSASGKVLLAAVKPDAVRERIGAAPLIARAPNTLTDPDKLMDELSRIRAQGWAVADDEMEEGTISIAVPIRAADGRVVAAMSLASHKMRLSLSDLIDNSLSNLQEAAARVGDMIAMSESRGVPVG